MSVPTRLRTARMTDATPAVDIDNQVGALEQAICDILGIPIDTDISVALFSVAAGGLTGMVFRNAAADPATVGLLQRNGTLLKFHDGNNAKQILSGLPLVKSTNKSVVSSTAISVDSQLTVPLAANEVFLLRYILHYTSVAGGAIHFGFAAPALLTFSLAGVGSYSADPSAGTVVQEVELGVISSIGDTMIFGGSTARRVAIIEGVVRNAGTPGDFTIGFGQSSSSATPTVLYANSYVLPIKIG